MSIFTGKKALITIPVAVVLLLVPLFTSTYWTHLVIYSLWIVFLCASYNISASAGQLSMMHTIFLGAGAYTSTVLWVRLGISPWIGLPAGMLFAAILALAFGYLTHRLEMPMLAFCILSLAITNIGMFVVQSSPYLGGAEGMSIRFTRDNALALQWVTKVPYYYIILAAAVVAVIVNARILNSKLGYYFKAIDQNLRGAKAMGINPVKYLTLSLVISGTMWAFAGTFWAQYAAFIDPRDMVGPHLIITIVILATVGGVGTIWGPVIIPFLMVFIMEYIRGEIGGVIPGIAAIIYGLAIVIVLLRLRTGYHIWWARRLRLKAHAQHAKLPAASHTAATVAET